jgi:phosphoglycolate phosphatase
MKAKAVIFDLDGTLFNSIADIAASCNKMLKNHGFKTYSEKDYLKWIGNGAYKLVERALKASVPDLTKEVVLLYLMEYNQLYLEHCTEKSEVYDGIPFLLDELTNRKVLLNINTNKPQEITEKVVQHYFAKWKFIHVIGQQGGGVKKPDPTAALFIAHDLKRPPSEIFFVGDSDVDAQTGKNAGMPTIGVTWGYRKITRETGFDFLVNTPEELLKIIG